MTAEEQDDRRPSWLDLTPADVREDAPDVPLSLFAAPDPCGTGDLFADLDGQP